MSLWCAMKAPLLIGTDLTIAKKEVLEILGNVEAIAINQDKLGVQAAMVKSNESVSLIASKPPPAPIPEGPLVWAGPLDNGDSVLALVNQDNNTMPISVDLASVFPHAHSFDIRNIWEQTNQSSQSGTVTYSVGPHDTALLRLTPH